MIKGREVMEKLQKRNLDPVLVGVMVTLAEDNQEMKQRLMQVASLLDKATDNMQVVMSVGDGLRKSVESINKQFGNGTVSSEVVS